MTVLSSVAIHACLAWAAFNMPRYFDFAKDKKEIIQPVYTMNFVPLKANQLPAIEKTPSKKVKPKLKKVLNVVKPKSFYEQKRAKAVVTQIQKSPVQVMESRKLSPDHKTRLPEKRTLFAAKSKPDPAALPQKTEAILNASEDLMKPAESIGTKEVSDGRLLRQAIGNQPPQYPVPDRIRKQTGQVIVLGYVDKVGDVQHVQVDHSSGTHHMETSSLQAFSNYKFQKGQEGWVKMPFEFTLDGEARVISVRNTRLLRSIK